MTKYETVNLNLFPIESEVSQTMIQDTCNEYSKRGFKLEKMEILDESNVMLVFKKD